MWGNHSRSIDAFQICTCVQLQTRPIQEYFTQTFKSFKAQHTCLQTVIVLCLCNVIKEKQTLIANCSTIERAIQTFSFQAGIIQYIVYTVLVLIGLIVLYLYTYSSVQLAEVALDSSLSVLRKDQQAYHFGRLISFYFFFFGMGWENGIDTTRKVIRKIGSKVQHRGINTIL